MTLNPSSLSRTSVLIRQTPLSLILCFSAASELVFSSTFGGSLTFDVLLALGLMLTGILFSLAFQFFQTNAKVEQTATGLEKLGVWTLFLLFVFVGTSVLIPQITSVTLNIITVQTFYASIPFNLAQPSGLTAAAVFIVLLIPCSEEQFFRGAWGNFFLVLFKKQPFLAPIPGGLVFALFHFAVYGLNYQTLGILFVDGATMISVDAFATGTIDSSILAHMGNNALSFGVAAGIIQSFLPGMAPAAVLLIRFAVPLTLGGVMMVKAFRNGSLRLPGMLRV